MITLPSLNALPSKWNEIREQLETDFSADLEALLHERFTEHEAKQFEHESLFWLTDTFYHSPTNK